MSFKYCTSCGHKNTYLAIEPKFCSECGAPTNESVSSENTKAKPLRKAVKKEVSKEPLTEYESDSEFVPDISGLQYEVSAFEKKTWKAEELLNLPDDENPEKTR